ncbi:valine--tRNA ligase [Jannaschia sp. LMIT008]|uniref:valine--tRNA ligase n=1 Tax=Jannaschia maritima TaxID=3032585 RepID=UPI0028113292|nr:valine--tRNA ligase [Jannaschia sp. LMIT008]
MPMEKTFDAAAAEPRISRDWIEGGYFCAGANAKPGAPAFSIVIPPPNVTGSLHMGHAFNNTLQDVLTRWHRMRGHDTLWQPGTDHAGIATQMVTERDMSANGEPTRQEMGRDAFLDRVWQQKAKSRGTIIGQLQRLGASCDWEREAFTMGGAPGDPDPTQQNFHDAVIKVFVEMYEKGLIYRGKRLVNWDPRFETAISNLEVENRDVAGHMWHFKYPLADGATYEYVERDEDGAELFRETRDYIAIATTRPETMLGDGAVAVHPSDERYAPIVGKLCEIPVGPKEHRRLIPIVTDEYPDPTFGSGAVKITGAHDFNDYDVAKRGGIPLYRLMDTKAAMRADGEPYADAAAKAKALREGTEMSEAEVDAINLVPDEYRGLDRLDARARVVADITAEGLAVMVPPTDPRLGAASRPKSRDPEVAEQNGSAKNSGAPDQVRGVPPLAPEEGADALRTDADALVPLVEPKQIQQPHGDRSGAVIEPMLTDQWFVDTDAIVGPAIEAVEDGTVRILPEADRKVYFQWLRNIEPWCISRQLWWGHRIPVWYGPPLKLLTGAGSTERTTFCAPTYADAAEQADQFYRSQLEDRLKKKTAAGGHCSLCVLEADEDTIESVGEQRDQIEWMQSLGIEGAEGLQAIDAFQQLSSGGFRIQNDRKTGDQTLTVKLAQDPDVLDTWFSSGLWPLGTLGWPDDTPELERYFPTSVLVTGFDILFFWVARMMMMQTAVLPDMLPLKDRVPFRDVYVHALVRDEKGKKMSKSLGNVLDPLDLIDEYGADAVRFTLASMAAMGRDLKLSTDRIKGYRNFGTKLWNATRFAEMNGATHGQVGQTQGRRAADAQQTLNRWIVGEVARTRAEVDVALDAYRFDDAAGALYKLVWNVVCDWYVELSKPILQGEDTDSKAETQATMAWVLDACTTMLHPFMPFLTEELWSVTGHEGMLVHGAWPEDLDPAQAVDEAAETEIRWVIAFIESIRSARAQMGVPAGHSIPVLRLAEGDSGKAAYDGNSELIQRLARIDGVTDADAAPKGSATVTVGASRYAMPLEGVIDAAAEAKRLDKALGKLDKEIKGLSGRASNPNFAASAPPEVVEETKANLAARQAERDVVAGALSAVRELT